MCGGPKRWLTRTCFLEDREEGPGLHCWWWGKGVEVVYV